MPRLRILRESLDNHKVILKVGNKSIILFETDDVLEATRCARFLHMHMELVEQFYACTMTHAELNVIISDAIKLISPSRQAHKAWMLLHPYIEESKNV